ncbi:hypothetical protein MRB53_011455 [Persea americana]|uniref:Uncharacterized protein n=1 Tax=Persea americana TaxID=3435 RepID=A0ACC2LVG2_PERAE|nr:hypothetical protein MRB53_011455 [Persea americana]
MAEGDLVQPEERHSSLGLQGLGILSTVAQLFQTIKQGSGGGGGEEKKISLIASFSLIAFAASVVLPLCYINICCCISFFFSVLVCAFLLSQFVPDKLFWVPYIACIFPLLHLLQLLPAPLQRSLQQRWWATWNAIVDAACRAHHAIVRSLEALRSTSSSVKSNSNPGRSTSSCSAAAPAGSMEEGDAYHVINGPISPFLVEKTLAELAFPLLQDPFFSLLSVARLKQQFLPYLPLFFSATVTLLK